jgi:hypothetical protein
MTTTAGKDYEEPKGLRSEEFLAQLILEIY